MSSAPSQSMSSGHRRKNTTRRQSLLDCHEQQCEWQIYIVGKDLREKKERQWDQASFKCEFKDSFSAVPTLVLWFVRLAQKCVVYRPLSSTTNETRTKLNAPDGRMDKRINRQTDEQRSRRRCKRTKEQVSEWASGRMYGSFQRKNR